MKYEATGDSWPVISLEAARSASWGIFQTLPGSDQTVLTFVRDATRQETTDALSGWTDWEHGGGEIGINDDGSLILALPRADNGEPRFIDGF